MKEWYITKPPTSVSGYEEEVFTDYSAESFEEALSSYVADEVSLFNYDLSEDQKIKAVIQGNTADTQLKSLERQILCPIGTLKSGMYVYFEGSYWLVNGRPGNNKSYEKATLVLCQYQLKWQNSTGKIVERWINATSASKYDIGEDGNKTIITSSNTFTILLPNDDESMDLDEKRVFIDRKQLNPTKVFKLTRSDDVLYDYGKNLGGILNLIANKVEFNPEADNQELRICDYFTPTQQPNPDETTDSFFYIPLISCTQPTIKSGSQRKFTAVFTTKDTGIINTQIVPKWEIKDCDFIDHLKLSYIDNSITVATSNDNLIGKNFRLSLSSENNDSESTSIVVRITSLY